MRREAGALGVERTGTADWIIEWDLFSISPADEEKPPTRGLHIGFTAPSREQVDAFWQAGVDAGYRDDGAPGPRPFPAPRRDVPDYGRSSPGCAVWQTASTLLPSGSSTNAP